MLAELGQAGPARSPTYTLVEPYRLDDRDLYHCDLYRLRHPDELEDIGLRDFRSPRSVLLVEWPERAEGRLGEVDVSVTLSYAEGDARQVQLQAETQAGRRVMARL